MKIKKGNNFHRQRQHLPYNTAYNFFLRALPFSPQLRKTNSRRLRALPNAPEQQHVEQPLWGWTTAAGVMGEEGYRDDEYCCRYFIDHGHDVEVVSCGAWHAVLFS